MSQSEVKNGTNLTQRSPHREVKFWAWAMGGPVGLILVVERKWYKRNE